MGGRFKGGRFEDLRDVVRARARRVVAIGEARPLIQSAFDGVVPVDSAETMNDAVSLAFTEASPGDVVLLAPACASFDMFENYAARGKAFKDAVGRLLAVSGRQ
jgi:UDP-N-acetylmuramoylalanine--D-glutamate ligase